MKKWNTEEIKYLKDNYFLKPVSEIASYLGRSQSSIRAKCHDINLVKKSLWSDEEVIFLKNNYAKYSLNELSKKLDRTENSVKSKAIKLGIQKNHYQYNKDFFETIDHEDKAYWLGFIMADGWVTSNKQTNSSSLGIQLQYSDIEHLDKFNTAINGNHRIETGEKCCKLSKYSDKRNKYCRIRIYSQKMVDDLKKLGVTSNKTYSMNWPTIPENLIRHFIRGYFDGDGCVRIKSYSLSNGSIRTHPICDITGKDKHFLVLLRDYLSKTLNITSYIYRDRTDCYRLYIFKKTDSIKFLQFLYINSNTYLSRKFIKAIQIIKNHTDGCLAC